MTPSGAYRSAHAAQDPFCHPKDAIRHNLDISGAWTSFVFDQSEGFRQAGVERVNDSIRNYVWAILGAQAQTRSNILKTGTGFMPIRNSWQISKTRLPRLWTSPAASVGIKNTPVCVHAFRSRLRNRALSDAERHGAPPELYPWVQQPYPDSRIGRGAWTQPRDKRGGVDQSRP